MGNSQDITNPNFIDQEVFQIMEILPHPLFGQIYIIKVKNPKSQTISKNFSPHQLYMSIEPQIPKINVLQTIAGINKLAAPIDLNILKLIDKGSIFEINQNYKGVLFEYEKKSLLEEINQRQIKGQYFTQQELFYILFTILSVTQALLRIPQCQRILKELPLTLESILLTKKGILKYANHIVYLTKKNEMTNEKPKFFSKLANQINEQKKQSQNTSDNNNQIKLLNNQDNSDIDLKQLETENIRQIGILMAKISSLNIYQIQEEDIKFIKENYTNHFINILISMTNEEQPKLENLVKELEQIKEKFPFATCIDKNSKNSVDQSKSSIQLNEDSIQKKELKVDIKQQINKLENIDIRIKYENTKSTVTLIPSTFPVSKLIVADLQQPPYKQNIHNVTPPNVIYASRVQLQEPMQQSILYYGNPYQSVDNQRFWQVIRESRQQLSQSRALGNSVDFQKYI